MIIGLHQVWQHRMHLDADIDEQVSQFELQVTLHDQWIFSGNISERGTSVQIRMLGLQQSPAVCRSQSLHSCGVCWVSCLRWVHFASRTPNPLVSTYSWPPSSACLVSVPVEHFSISGVRLEGTRRRWQVGIQTYVMLQVHSNGLKQWQRKRARRYGRPWTVYVQCDGITSSFSYCVSQSRQMQPTTSRSQDSN